MTMKTPEQRIEELKDSHKGVSNHHLYNEGLDDVLTIFKEVEADPKNHTL